MFICELIQRYASCDPEMGGARSDLKIKVQNPRRNYLVVQLARFFVFRFYARTLLLQFTYTVSRACASIYRFDLLRVICTTAGRVACCRWCIEACASGSTAVLCTTAGVLLLLASAFCQLLYHLFSALHVVGLHIHT